MDKEKLGKIELEKVKMERKGEKWRESSTVVLIDSLLPFFQFCRISPLPLRVLY